MLRRRWKDWNQDKLDRFLGKGRGQGVREDYQPFIQTRDFSSKAGNKRIPGVKINRLHHTFSNHERRMLFLLEWMDCVVDIREQFPLLDLDLARQLAEEAGIRYPKNRATGFPYVLTTDFMVTISSENREFDFALTIKPPSELQSNRVRELYEIERRYYIQTKTEWYLVTSEHIPSVLADNIKYFRPNSKLEATNQLTTVELREVAPKLKHRIQSLTGEDYKISLIMNDLDMELELTRGTCLKLFKHLIARKEILLDMETPEIYKGKNFSTKIIKSIIL